MSSNMYRVAALLLITLTSSLAYNMDWRDIVAQYQGNNGQGNIGTNNGMHNTGTGNGHNNRGDNNGNWNSGNNNGNNNWGSNNGNNNGGSNNGNNNWGSNNGNNNGGSNNGNNNGGSNNGNNNGGSHNGNNNPGSNNGNNHESDFNGNGQGYDPNVFVPSTARQHTAPQWHTTPVRTHAPSRATHWPRTRGPSLPAVGPSFGPSVPQTTDYLVPKTTIPPVYTSGVPTSHTTKSYNRWGGDWRDYLPYRSGSHYRPYEYKGPSYEYRYQPKPTRHWSSWIPEEVRDQGLYY